MTSRMEWTDEAAAAETRKGDRNAFRVLVDRHSRALFRLAYRMTGNESDAEDVVQETFLRAYKQIKQFDCRSSFSTWVYRICSNCALDVIRSRKAREKQREPVGEEKTTSWIETIAARDPDPERLMHSGQIARLLEPALEQLSEMERVAFTLRHFEGCNVDEIARTLGVQQNAAKHSVFRAVQKLRRALEPAWGVTR
jgi:RNA polymerase sigma-70 factor, ECF subfamily